MNLVQYPKRISIKTALPKKYVVWHGSFSRTKYSPYGKTLIRPTAILDQWELSKEKFGAPYLIDRDGTVYKVYDDKDWTYHLNLAHTKGHYDKQSVPIMLANELNLLRVNGQFYAFEYDHSTNYYSGPVVSYSWNTHQYWAKIDDSQFDAALDITLDVCKRHNIEPIFYVGNRVDPKLWERATIFTHSMVSTTANDFPPFSNDLIAKIKTRGIKVIE